MRSPFGNYIMKTTQKWVWRLLCALALATVAGCASNQGQGGYTTSYQQGTGYGNEYEYGNQWNSPGPPYEWQHPSPRDQMTP